MNILKMLTQAGAIQKELKGLQKELEAKTVEAESGGVRVSARGDMSIDSIKIDPAIINSSDPARLERAVVSAVNSALNSAKREAGQEISKIAGGLGLGDLLKNG